MDFTKPSNAFVVNIRTYVYYIIRMQSASNFRTSASMARAALYALFDLGLEDITEFANKAKLKPD